MTDTVPIATFLTRQAADEGADLLRANGIKCAVVDPPSLSSVLGRALGDRPQYTLIVAPGDERRARESLDGFLGARWFLRTADGRPAHSFEAATAERLRLHRGRTRSTARRAGRPPAANTPGTLVSSSTGRSPAVSTSFPVRM